MVSRRVHNPEEGGPIPSIATMNTHGHTCDSIIFGLQSDCGNELVTKKRKINFEKIGWIIYLLFLLYIAKELIFGLFYFFVS